MKKLVTDLRNLPNKLIYNIIVLFSVFIVIYAYFILSWSIGMDTELATYGLGNSEYLYPLHTQYFLLDRPTLAIITYVLGQVAIPYFTLLISMSLLFVSAIIWMVILTKKNFSIIETLVFCSFYLISPIYIFQFNFAKLTLCLDFLIFYSGRSKLLLHIIIQ
ncbi:glucosyl transferase GtrII family protein [Francisella sp. TX07-6608]|nr:glucosyl transferase GtrII family protein [Francisella sp. TX07-6608]